jgi:hypothetical protein
MGKDPYLVYGRRDDGQVVEVRNAKLDNRWVIPFNTSLLMLYNCHINVEICSSIKIVKYLYKYIYKGHDGASYSVDKSDNGDKAALMRLSGLGMLDVLLLQKQHTGYMVFLYIRCILLSFSLQYIYQVCIWWHTMKEMTCVMLSIMSSHRSPC